MQKITYNIVAEALSGCQTEPVSGESARLADTAGKEPDVFCLQYTNPAAGMIQWVFGDILVLEYLPFSLHSGYSGGILYK